jgi:hypothetical protein
MKNDDIVSALDPEHVKGIDIDQIISAPLVAAANANSMMLKDQTQFIMDFCFSYDGDNYKPVMIPMTVTRTYLETPDDPEKKPVFREFTTRFNVPLITLIPINSLGVELVKVSFELELTNQVEEKEDSGESEQTWKKKKKTRLLGNVSYDTEEHTSGSHSKKNISYNSSKLKVNIDAGSLPLPPGITTLMDLYSKSIMPDDLKRNAKNKE